MIELFSTSRDEVIKSAVSQARTNYAYAIENLYPLINKFEQQRKLQNRKFYDRLRADIVKGCIMPPITLAFVDTNLSSSLDSAAVTRFITENIESGYVLDGMQRLNTLKEASSSRGFNGDNPLHLTVLIAERYDLLLYRMITLNNGQRPMTARHQIEMLTKGLLDTESLSIEIVSEKESEGSKPRGVFRRSDISEAYTAFLTNSVHNQNSRIIETKLDEILVGKVMESDLSESDVSFHDVLAQVDRLSKHQSAKDWLRLGNNLIGFSVGARKGLAAIAALSPVEFSQATEIFEAAFQAMDASKINVGRYRRELSALFVAQIDKFSTASVDDLTEAFFEATLAE